MKETMISLRITYEEKRIIEQKAKASGLSVSQYIRKRMDIYNIDNTNNNMKVGICPFIICNIHTEIQKLQQNNPEINTDELERKVLELWHM